MRDVTVTVVMATYNGAATLRRAVVSVQQQSYEDWRLIIVDDASSDGTASTLQGLIAEDPRVRVVRNQTNRGLAASLNRGLREVDTPLIARMDVDDVSHPQRLRAQLDAFEARPDLDVLGTGVHLVDDAGNDLGSASPPAEHDRLVADMYRRSPFYHPTVMFRRDFITRAGGYDERLRRAQDQDLWLRTYRTSTFANLQQQLLTYSVRARPSWRTALSGTYVLGLNAWREKAPAKAVFAPRYLAAAVRTRSG